MSSTGEYRWLTRCGRSSFFFQAEDGIRDYKVTGVQTCALPIFGDSSRVVVGQPVAAIGSPFGNVDSLSVGVVSAIRRSIPSLTSKYDLVDAIQKIGRASCRERV